MQIAPGQINPDTRRNNAVRTDGRDHLHLMMQVCGHRRIGDIRPEGEGAGRLHEDDGFNGGIRAAHLPDVLGIILSDAENPVQRKRVGPFDRDRNGRGGRKKITHEHPHTAP